MKLWIYSSGGQTENEAMDLALMHNMIKQRLIFTFVTSSFADSSEYYDEFITRFSHYAYIDFHILHPDRSLQKRDRFRALNSDVIYLSGGNTFYFLHTLRQSDFLQDLKYFVETGGILAGHSAGGILMTPSIETASFPSFDRDENEVQIADWKALKLVPFYFFPHFRNSRRYTVALMQESSRCNQVIYGVPDGCGIVVMNQQMTFFGSIWGFVNGNKFRLSCRIK